MHDHHSHSGAKLVQIAGLDGLEARRDSIPKIKHAPKPNDHNTQFLVGLDVGSTTVKAVVVDARADQVLWQDRS